VLGVSPLTLKLLQLEHSNLKFLITPLEASKFSYDNSILTPVSWLLDFDVIVGVVLNPFVTSLAFAKPISNNF